MRKKGILNLSPKQVGEIITQYNRGNNVSRIADLFDIPLPTIKTVIRRKRLNGGIVISPLSRPPSWATLSRLQNQIAPQLKGYWHIRGDWMITSDWQIPTYSILWAERLLKVACQYKIKKLLIAGDFFNADIYSIFTINKQQITPKMEAELSTVEAVLKILDKWFSESLLLLGNHEKRLFSQLLYSIEAERIAKMMGIDKLRMKFTFSPYPYCILDGKWRVTHPDSYRQVKLSVANDLATKHRMHIMMAHGHFFSLGYSKGGYQIADSGGLFDASRIPYIQFHDTTHPQWSNGFWRYQNGIMFPYAEGWTDFK
jgi:hypothetical protein